MAETKKAVAPSDDALTIVFTVHNVSTVPVRAPVDYRGTKIMADVDCLEVEFVSDNEHGNFTARFVGPDAAKARARFRPDQRVTISF